MEGIGVRILVDNLQRGVPPAHLWDSGWSTSRLDAQPPGDVRLVGCRHHGNARRMALFSFAFPDPSLRSVRVAYHGAVGIP